MRYSTTALRLTLIMLLGTFSAAAIAATPKIPPDIVAPEPTVLAPPPGITGPTENITKVAQAITTRAKSLTSLVVFAPGVPITQPVTISILYLSPAGNQRITQSYVPSTGNRFLYNDPEGDGKRRPLHMHINFEEPKPEGGIYTFTWSSSLFLDPLYDVSIGPLEFTLFTDCDWFGNSEIQLRGWRFIEFNTWAGEHNTIQEFAWNRPEVSASDRLQMPNITFYEVDWDDWGPDWLAPVSFDPGQPFKDRPLVPGTTRQVVETIEEANNQCSASVQYNITYELRWYPFL